MGNKLIYDSSSVKKQKENAMSKKLCKLVKDDILDKDIKEYIKFVSDAKFVCRKCGRTAKKEENLCSAKKLKYKEE